MVSDNTPVIVGVGQVVERIDAPDYRGLSPADLAAEAVRRACGDTGAGGTLAAIEAIGAIRTFEDSTPQPTPFGKPDKFPRAISRRLGIEPPIAKLEKAGGQSPVALIADLGSRIAAGLIDAAVAVGSEAISTARHLKSLGEARDWSEALDGPMENRGAGLAGIVMRYHMTHGLFGAPAGYGLLENARRARLGLSREDYAAEMGRLFAPFTAVAAANPYASAAVSPNEPADLTRVTERNRMVADPYPVKLVARDQVNQAAAVIVMSAGRARQLGIPEDKWLFLHGCALFSEREIIERPDLGASPAARAALREALSRAGKGVADIGHFDFYSCFPIAVFAAAVDGLGLEPDDPRQLTVTGGLPYFGGPGNNYSMHALASMTEVLRRDPGSFGLVGANGGYLSKYGAMVLSTAPAEWPDCDSTEGQEELDAVPPAPVAAAPEGWATLLTYTVVHGKNGPSRAIAIGELEAGGRFMANAADERTLASILAEDPIGRRIYVHRTADGNRIAFDRETIGRIFPKARPALRDSYRYLLVERRGPVLEVTINRPEARNALPVAAHHEMADLFDAFEADPELWVAILTGAGNDAFCAGMDLKATAAGESREVPLSGFAGLTSRAGRTKPIIAAINGIAFGGGTETLLACDLVVADPSAKFGLTEVRVGVIAGAGGALRLPRQLPRKVAMDMLLTGRHMGAEEAMRHGLISRMSEPGAVMAEARRLADEIVGVSPTSVRLTMQLVNECDAIASPDEAAAAMLRSPAIDELLMSEDMVEGLTAFAQKRAPQWKNR